MENPDMDQERVQSIKTSIKASGRKNLLAAWGRSEKELPLVELDIEWVRFSTANNRTQAEQMQIVQREGGRDLFKQDPLGDIAQDHQYKILKAQRGFVELKKNLKEDGQKEPAVVDGEGVLINGNRRVAALRALYEETNDRQFKRVLCNVLPQDATQEEIIFLEAELQVARDYKQAYSWINEALLIQKLTENNDRNYASRPTERSYLFNSLNAES